MWRGPGGVGFSAAAGVRWLAGKGPGGVGYTGEGNGGNNKNIKKRREKRQKQERAVAETAQAQLHRTLAKEIEYEREGIKEPALMKPPKGWKRVDIDDFVNRGDEGIIVLRKNFQDHRIDLVASTQLVDTSSEDVSEDDDEEPDAQGASAALLIAVTKLGRGKPLMLECLANQETGCTITSVSVGIDPGVYLSSVYGPITPLYLTYSALWDQELASAGIEAGENHFTEETLDLWNAAKQELENDSSAVKSPDFYELEPAFQEAVQDLIDARVEPKVIDFLMDALEDSEQRAYLLFLESSLTWVKP